MTTPRVAITVTVADADPSICDFVHYHLGAGLDRIFVFFDDPASELADMLPDDDRVAVAVCDDELRACWAEWPDLQRLARHELVVRRMLNAELAFQLSRNDDIDWLVQLAPDELLHGDGGLGALIEGVPEHVGQVTFGSMEAIPESDDVTRPFHELTLFKRTRACLTHNGHRAIARAGQSPRSWFYHCEPLRSAMRTRLDARPNAAYLFDAGKHELHTTLVPGARALRYPHGTLRAFVERYSTWDGLGPGRYGHIPIDQAGVDRLLAARAEAMGGEARAARYYREHVVVGDREVSDALLAAGLCERIEGPRAFLQGARDVLD